MIEKYYSEIALNNLIQDSSLKQIHSGIEKYTNDYFNFDFDPSNPVVRLHEPTFGADEIKAAVNTLLSTKVTSGKSVIEFEESFSKKVKLNNCVSSNSGSSANLLAVSSICNPDYKYHLNEGDEVIVSALSWSTTVWPLIQNKLIPVIVDIDLDTLNISIEEVKKAINPKTKAIMPVHVYGNPCNMSELISICKENNLVLIEDCCEALGAEYDNEPVGTIGNVGTFSFYFSHHITTLEGGITVTDDDNLAELMRIIRAHGWVRDMKNSKIYSDQFRDFDERFLFVNLGYNLRLTELQANFGLNQINKLDGIVNKRRNNTNMYKKKLTVFSNEFSFQQETKNSKSSCFGFPIILKKTSNVDLNNFTSFLNKNKIESRPIICGNIAKQPAMKKFPHITLGDLSNSNYVMQNSFSIGNHQNINEQSIDYVASKIQEFLDN